MPTKIVNKLYDGLGNVIGKKSAVSCMDVDRIYNINTTFCHVPKQPKRINKNLESLIADVNSRGYVVGLSQIEYDGRFMWFARIQNPESEPSRYAMIASNPYTYDTPYKALKATWDIMVSKEEAKDHG